MARALKGDDLSRVPAEELLAELERRRSAWIAENGPLNIAFDYDIPPITPPIRNTTTIRDISTVEAALRDAAGLPQRKDTS